jgi:ElaB/YqjD/DUF883 family membrane-anchored ribosome-binding protein
MYMTDVCGDLAAGLWRATARAAASGMNPAKPAQTSLQGMERRMTTHEQRDRNTVTERFADKAHDTVDAVAERAQRAESEAREVAARAAERARQLHEDTAQRAERGMRRAASYIDSNPLAFAGLAFVAGVLLSTLVRR